MDKRVERILEDVPMLGTMLEYRERQIDALIRVLQAEYDKQKELLGD